MSWQQLSKSTTSRRRRRYLHSSSPSPPIKQICIRSEGEAKLRPRQLIERRHAWQRAPHSHYHEYTEPRLRRPSHRYQFRRAEPQFEWYVDQVLNRRWRVVGLLGDGTFGRVLEVEDGWHRGRFYAVKVSKSDKASVDAAEEEASIMKYLDECDPEHQSGCVRVFDAYFHRGHHCLVMERLGPDLCEFGRKMRTPVFSLRVIQIMARDLFKCVAFMDRLHVAHTDLKLENVVLVNDDVIVDESGVYRPRDAHVKIVDFGNATFVDKPRTGLINTTQYRAPEVVLELEWTQLADMWCLGCVLMELYTGQLLFRTHDSLEHLALIERIVGPIPQRMLAQSRKPGLPRPTTGSVQTSKYPLAEALTDAESYQYVCREVPLEVMLELAPPEFCSLLRQVLVIDPLKRARAQDLIPHPFLTMRL